MHKKIKVLWITNILQPDIAVAMDLPKPVIGGWMHSLIADLRANAAIEFAIASTWNQKVITDTSINDVRYFVLPYQGGAPEFLQERWREVVERFNPDLIHIHGTEFPIGLQCMLAAPSIKYVISIQGLTSIIAKYWRAGISPYQIIRHISFRDIIRRESIFDVQAIARKNGKYERMYLQKASDVIGRTNWDYAHTKAINANLNYHHCDETLRPEFYIHEKWHASKINRHTIFLSQSERPIKGLHIVLKTAKLLVRQYPKLIIKVGGADITRTDSLAEKLRISGYGLYVRSLIRKFGLSQNVQFLGRLTADEMAENYRKAHVFVSPSSIENSPNSVAEAQLIGTPCIGSFVGGTPDMIEHNSTGFLYRFDEPEMLAHYVSKIFDNDELASKLSAAGIERATKRHDMKHNFQRLIEIYSKVSKAE